VVSGTAIERPYHCGKVDKARPLGLWRKAGGMHDKAWPGLTRPAKRSVLLPHFTLPTASLAEAARADTLVHT